MALKISSVCQFVYQRIPMKLAIVAIARVSGYARDMLLAILFGPTPVADLFVYGFRLQLALRAFLSDQTMNALVVPAYLAAPTPAARQSMFARLVGGLLIVAMPVWVVLILCQPLFLSVFAPGFSTKSLVSLGGLSAWQAGFWIGGYASAGLILVSLSAVFLARFQAEQRFVPAFAIPLVFNLVLAGGMVAVAYTPTDLKLHTLGFVFLTASFSQLICAWAVSKRLNLSFTRLMKPTKQAFITSGQAWYKTAAAKALEPLPLLLLFALGTHQSGGLTKLFLAERLFMFLPSVIGLYLSSIHLSHLGRQLANKRHDQALKSTGKTFLQAALIGAVGAPLLWLVAPLLSQVLFQHGAFGTQAAQEVGTLLRILCVALPLAAGEMILTQSFFAMRRFKVPFLASLSAVAFILLAIPAFQHLNIGSDLPLLAWLLVSVLCLRVSILTVGLFYTNLHLRDGARQQKLQSSLSEPA